MLAALLIAVAAAALADLSIEPDPPVVDGTVTINVAAGDVGRTVHLSDPFGRWHVALEVDGGELTATIPDGVPLLLVGMSEGEGVEFPVRLWPVHAADGAPLPWSNFWRAYVLAGFPAPLGVAERDEQAALLAAEEEVRLSPDNPVARELLWRLRARATDNSLELLQEIGAEVARSSSGRLALAAARVQQQLGNHSGAAEFASQYSSAIGAIQAEERSRWSGIIAERDSRRRIEAIHRWLASDPFSDFTPRCLQILAASYADLEDHRSTALFGLLSLRIMPSDAMTLNGVAYSMAEGGFELERALLLAGQAVEILENPNLLSRPTQLRERRWREELRHALAASLDTKGWVLTKLGRWQEARRAFDAALKLESSDVFFLHLGLMLAESGSLEEAKRTLRRGARLGGPNRLRIESELARLEM